MCLSYYEYYNKTNTSLSVPWPFLPRSACWEREKSTRQWRHHSPPERWTDVRRLPGMFNAEVSKGRQGDAAGGGGQVQLGE